MISMPSAWNFSFTSRLRPAPPERQNVSRPPVASRSFCPDAASFSHSEGTLMNTLGLTSVSTFSELARRAERLRARPRHELLLDLGDRRAGTGFGAHLLEQRPGLDRLVAERDDAQRLAVVGPRLEDSGEQRGRVDEQHLGVAVVR